MFHHVTLPRAVALALPIILGAWTVQAADIIQTAERDGRFNGFLHLLEAADMAETLKGKGPFTVFAPTDDAFDRLPPAMLDQLLTEENRKPLEAVVRSHIVADAAILTGHLLGRAVEVPTIGGGTLAIDGTTGIIALAPIEPSVTEVGGTTVEAANRFLREVYLPEHNARFAVPAEEPASAFVEVPEALWRDVLCLQEERQVGNDNCVRWHGRSLQIPPTPLRPHLVRATVRVHAYPDGTLAIFKGPHRLASFPPAALASYEELAA